jgi:predicted DNA-binding WGR domain protein
MATTPQASGPLRFLDFLHARGGFTTEDALATLLPLFRQVAATHAASRVAPLEGVSDVWIDEYRAYYEVAREREPRLESDKLKAIESRASAFDVVGRRVHTTEADAGEETHENLLVARPGGPIERPVYLPGYVSWEHRIGHHDALTDIYVLGLLLASVACGLDLGDSAQLESFAARRGNLFLLNPQLNPVLAKNIARMTELDRHRRAQDLSAVVRSLETYRDQDVALDFDPSRIPGFHDTDLKSRRRLVLARLRERLFEITRRNRLLYYRPTLQSLNLTFASVPILFDPRSIRPEQLFTWQPEVEKLLVDGAPIPLNRYLRFEDAPYVPSVLDKLISEARRDAAEFGFSQLRLVLAFLRWHNLKESRAERIDSPLLLLPVELTRKKGVRDSYVMRATSREAEVNPVLRYHLKQLYNLNLPHSIDLGETTIQAFFDSLVSQIQASEPGVVLSRLERPQIELVYERARRRLDQYRRRIPLPAAGLRSFRDIDYSYKRDAYQPLGLRLFIGVVRPSPAPLHDVFRERPIHRPQQMASPEPAPRPGKGEKQKVIAAFREGGSHDGNPYAWDFDLCSLTLGNFNYRKMSLVRDYNALLEEDQESRPFDAIFSDAPRETELAPAAAQGLSGRFPVVPCDPTQLSAIAAAESGASYIIQGPPGTGKSQTITNLVADLVARGKRVLFVCEKRAAIDVVYHRLRQRGLHDLVCLIHDSQADKKDFVLDLKASYERLLASAGADVGAPDERRRGCVEALEREARPLARFHDAMRATAAESGVSLRQLIVRVIELKARLPQLAPEQEDELPPYRAWVEERETLERLDRALRLATPDGVYARHPLRALQPKLAARERPRAGLEDDLRQVLRLLDHVAAVCREHGVALGPQDTLGRALVWTRYAAAVKPLADRGLLGLLDAASPASQALRARLAESEELQRGLEKAREETRAWRRKLEPRDLAFALERAQALAGSPLRFLKGDFWQLRRVLRERYDFTQHAIRPSYARVLQNLRAEYAAEEALAALAARARGDYGTESLQALASELASVRQTVSDLLGSAPDLQRERLDAGSARVVAGLVTLRDAVAELDRLAGEVFVDSREWTFEALREERARLSGSLRALPDWLPCLSEAAGLSEPLARAVRTLPLDLHELEAAVAAATLDAVFNRERGLARFSGSARERQAQRLEALHEQWLELNAALVVGQNRARFLDKVQRASLPSIRLSKEQEAFKRQYNLGRRELEHEFGKTMRYKSVRALLAGPAGEVILDLKPVWLMSPLSVSDTLPIDSRAFDAVVFDEASQIPLEEAVPTLFRGAQAIVSGDQMQLPPTNFFSATRTASDDVLLVEEDEDEAPVEYELDANSFLAHSARNLPSTLLGWHYRSRSESLISFSNAAFYAGRLLTVPERQALKGGLGEIRVQAPEQDGELNVAKTLDRPVSFHFLERGRYEARRNPGEATYIAQLVRGLVASESRPTIGIVAFSEAQQGEIEAAIERLAASDPEFRTRLEEEYEREEDSQFAGLLVKNLENIQGDERDVILLSVCYGYGPDGRMLMNFGPINQGGGEKRLNVAFSRAKKHMAVVSSIQYADIKNVYNDGANSLRSYLQYAAAMSAGEHALARVVLRGFNPVGAGGRSDDTQDGVVRLLAAALRERGYEVELALGHSHFRCDLAVKRPGDAAFRLAVFVDTEAYYRERDVLERDVLRPKLLRAFGWSVAHVLAKDWHEDAAGVMARLERQLSGEAGAAAAVEPIEPAPGEVEPLSDREVWLEGGPSALVPPIPTAPAGPEPMALPAGVTATPTPPTPPATPPPAGPPGARTHAASTAAVERTAPAQPPSAAPPPASPPPASAGPKAGVASPAVPAPAGGGTTPPAAGRISQLLPGQTRYFEFIGGSSKKYWHVTVDGCALVVSFGRIGTAGQLKRKTFPNEAMARHEAESLIREKLGKGYQEVHPD